MRHIVVRHATLLIALAIFLGFLTLRLPGRARFLTNWDSVNYALGTRRFNLEHHQPHPPGYIGYVAIGWVLKRLGGDANSSFTFLSAVSGAAAPASLFLLASRLMPRRYAAVTAVAFGLSPVVWYYSRVALGYAPEMALALLFLWVAYQARAGASLRHLLFATTLLVILGAVRQSGALFLIPVWLYVVYRFSWRRRALALGLLVVGNLAWLVPMIWLSGGPIDYVRASTDLAGLAVAPTFVLGFKLLGLVQNLGFVAAGILVGVNVGLLIIGIGHWSRSKPLGDLSPGDRRLLLLWLAPPLATFLLVHTGQLGYILLILPAGFLSTGLSLSALSRRAQRGWFASPANCIGSESHRTAALVTSLAGVLLVVNALGARYLPRQASRLARPDRAKSLVKVIDAVFDSLPLASVVSSEEADGVAQQARQYDVERNDQYWDELIHLLEEYDPSTTAVLAVPDGAGSFRHFTYYLPEYRVYALGRDLDENFGHLFTAHDGTSDYNVEGLDKTSEQLELPDGVTRLVVPDRGIVNRFPDDTDGVLVKLVGGAEVFMVPVPDGTTLRFVEEGEDDARIVFDPCPDAQ
jgi:hypothetical protein